MPTASLFFQVSLLELRSLICLLESCFFHISVVLKSSCIWKVHNLPFIKKSLLLSTLLRITPVVKDQTTVEDKEAAELYTPPTSTEVDVDLREPLLEVPDSQAAA